jgi:NAD(P)-dependent dehydrogenase (short-subunit alcohol dehydrogenase family)
LLLKNKVAFVTAAGSGIGAAGALAMAREGAYVVVTDRDIQSAKAVADVINMSG